MLFPSQSRRQSAPPRGRANRVVSSGLIPITGTRNNINRSAPLPRTNHRVLCPYRAGAAWSPKPVRSIEASVKPESQEISTGAKAR